MADYFSPTVIQPTIPLADTTPLERLILSHIFQFEHDCAGLYFFADQAPNELPTLPVDDVRTALVASEKAISRANGFVRAALAAQDEDHPYLRLDMSEPGWAFLFQDIVRRSSVIGYVSAVSAFTCSRMRPDGFGGMAMVIIADDVKAMTTDELIDEMLAKPVYGPIGVRPGLGVHILLRLTEAHVRAAITAIIEAPPSVAAAARGVTDVDIRSACLAVVAATDLSEEQDKAVQDAAHIAIQAAALRKSPPV